MDQLFNRLQSALGASYRLEKELGGGGMSRVFLAEETALHRKVVVKVLPPEYAAVLSADRFRQEIQLAAGLQHPHIVPLLTAGEAEGTLYYTMPFVEGESLRARLARDGALPIPQAVALLREVVDALDYAHRHGVVHRDIKPENILLSGQHAVVTDFGIAKALGSASTGTLTSAGLSLGTPAYMAPEQIAADPRIDHRADLYALGAMGYEMLTGKSPFEGRTPQAVLAAHLTERPAELTTRLPGCPPDLAAVIMQCLEKDASLRPGSAAAVRDRLDALASGAFAPVQKRWSTKLGIAAAVAAVLIVGSYFAGLWPGRSLVAQGVLDVRDPILVADVTNHTRDSTLALAVGEALRVDLTQSSTVTVFSGTQVSDALSRMQKPPGAPLDLTLARELAQREGIKAVVTGDIASVGPGYNFSAQLILAETGEPLVAVREVARDSTEIIEAIGKVSNALRRRIGESLKHIEGGQPLAQVTTPSLQALRKYSQALRIAATEGASPRADALLEEAVALDSGFAMAWRRLGVNYGNVGNRADQWRALKTALAHQDRLTERERYLTLGTYYTTVAPDSPKAIAAYDALLDLEPNNMPALNNLGLVYARAKDYPRMIEYYRRAIRADSSSATAWYNLVEAQLLLQQPDSATESLQQASARFPDYSGRPWIAAEVALNREQYDSARGIYAAIKASPSSQPEERGAANEDLMRLDLLEGRLGQARARLAENARLAVQYGVLNRALDAELTSASIDAWFLGDRAAAGRTIDAALRRYPLAQLDTVDRPYLDIAYLELLTGRTARARAALHEFEQLPPEIRDRSEAYRIGVSGLIALADGRHAEAIQQLQAAIVMDPCERCAYPDLGRAWEAAGQPDSAIAAYEKYLSSPMEDPLDIDSHVLAWAHKRLGELYDQKGDRENASLHLQEFIDLWKNADPVLQPQVTEAKRKLAELVGEKSD